MCQNKLSTFPKRTHEIVKDQQRLDWIRLATKLKFHGKGVSLDSKQTVKMKQYQSPKVWFVQGTTILSADCLDEHF